VADYDRGKVLDLLRELEFRTLAPRLPEQAARQARPAPAAERPPSVRVSVETPEQLAVLAARLREAGMAAIDTETTSLDWLSADLVGIALAVSAHESWYVPLRHRTDERPQLTPEAVRETLGPILADPGMKLIAHHFKYALGVMERAGYQLGTLDFETMLAAYLLGETSKGLKDLAFTRLGIEMTEISALIGSGKNQLSMNMVDSREAGEYACGDVEATFALSGVFRGEIAEQNQGAILRDLEQPLVPVLLRMEAAGIAVDVPYLKQLSDEIGDRMGALEVEMTKAAGRPVNVGSPKQLGALLFDELGLPTGKKTRTGYSVDADVLEGLRDKHPIVPLILEHRMLAKLKSTYVDALPMQVSPRDGRVHTSYNQTIAATGRLSSTDPNLQNIPIRTEMGKRVRRAFIADRREHYAIVPDAVLLSADYSQIELRLLADQSGEPFLIEAFRRGEDIHRATAAVVHGIPVAEVTPDQRRIAKTVNFGVLYGMQAFGLSRDTGLPRAEAQAFIDQYWERLPGVRGYFDGVIAFGSKNGYVETPMGRRRATPGLVSGNRQVHMAAERMAINMPLQGGAADIMKLAMIQLDRELRARPRLQARMLLQVHDELVLEVSGGDLEEAAALVRETMQGVAELRVPLLVEVSSGPNWEEQTDL
ncbi:MAG: DNA polymerase I, partial [Chloroflexota bacterium]